MEEDEDEDEQELEEEEEWGGREFVSDDSEDEFGDLSDLEDMEQAEVSTSATFVVDPSQAIHRTLQRDPALMKVWTRIRETNPTPRMHLLNLHPSPVSVSEKRLRSNDQHRRSQKHVRHPMLP